MAEKPLARLWRLPDGTACFVSREGSLWRLVVVKGDAVERREHFADGGVALLTAQRWREECVARTTAA